MHQRFHWPVTASLLLLLAPIAGCKLGPNYKRPPMETPTDWRWKVAEPQDRAPRTGWWKVFEDPELDALQQEASENNLDLKAAVARVEQARATARIDRSYFYPSITADPAFVRYRTSGHSPSPVPFPVPSFTQQQWQIPFDLSYEVDIWGRVRRSFESARELAFAAAAARETVLLTLQADVAATYFSLQSANVDVDLLRQTIDLRKEGVDIFEKRLQAGIGSEFEVQRGRTEAASAEALWQAALRRRAELVNTLALLVAKAPSNFEPIISTNRHLPSISPDIPSALLERRPDVAQAERELSSRLAQIGVAQAAFFPSVHLTMRAGLLSGEVSDLFSWESRIWSIGPGITIPIFEGGRNRATLDRAKASYEEGISLYRQKVLVAFKEVEDSLAALQFLKGETDARAEAAAAARQAARLSIERYRAGAIAFLEVIDSESARLQNELAHVRAANEQMLATVRLIKALGGGWK